MLSATHIARMRAGKQHADEIRRAQDLRDVAAYREWIRREARAFAAWTQEPTALNRERLVMVRASVPRMAPAGAWRADEATAA